MVDQQRPTVSTGSSVATFGIFEPRLFLQATALALRALLPLFLQHIATFESLPQGFLGRRPLETWLRPCFARGGWSVLTNHELHR